MLVLGSADLSDGSGWLTSLLNVDALINSPALSVYVLIKTSECTVDISLHTVHDCRLRTGHLSVHCHRPTLFIVGCGRVCNIAPRAATSCSLMDMQWPDWSKLHQSTSISESRTGLNPSLHQDHRLRKPVQLTESQHCLTHCWHSFNSLREQSNRVPGRSAGRRKAGQVSIRLAPQTSLSAHYKCVEMPLAQAAIVLASQLRARRLQSAHHTPAPASVAIRLLWYAV